jgi:hypothetical protein
MYASLITELKRTILCGRRRGAGRYRRGRLESGLCGARDNSHGLFCEMPARPSWRSIALTHPQRYRHTTRDSALIGINAGALLVPLRHSPAGALIRSGILSRDSRARGLERSGRT